MIELLRTEGLTKRFRGLVANDNVDFALEAGEVRCVIGPNGAGKTTFISMISGHLTPTAGRIWFKGREITDLSVARRARLGIARKFQTPSVFDRLTVYNNLELAALGKPVSAGERAAHIRRCLRSPATRASECCRVRSLARPAPMAGVGMLLLNRADLLLLDEPTAGMTAEETSATGELIPRSPARTI